MMKQIRSLAGLLCICLFAVSGLAAVSEAPSFRLPAIGGEIDLAQLEGKVVYLDFWASWCEPCRDSFPWMTEIQQKYRDQGLEIIAVNLDKERRLADGFLQQMDINFIVAFDPSGETASRYDLGGMPGSYLIGRDGNIHASHLGFRDKDKAKLEKAIQQLLQQPQEKVK